MVRYGLGAALIFVLSACSGGNDTTEAPTASGGGSTTQSAEFGPTLSNQELMAHVIDYNAFEIWHRQGWVYTADGVEELFPTDDAGWFAAESAAATLAELSNVLLLPSHIPDDSPEDWVRYAHELNRTAREAMDTAEAQDKEAFFDAGGDIYVVCSSCHLKFVIGE